MKIFYRYSLDSKIVRHKSFKNLRGGFNWVLLKTGLRPTACDGSAARQPEDPADPGPWPATAKRPSGPVQIFRRFFVQRLIHGHAQVCIGFGHAKWTTVSLRSFTIIILSNHFDPFICCMLLREKCCHSLLIRPSTKPEREEVHSQWCELFSNHSLRLKIWY